MKAVVQRVLNASVEIDGEITGEIPHGLLVYICFEEHDTQKSMESLIHKILNLRIFEDEEKKMNHNIRQSKGSILSISQFTLSWDGKKGHRPSFDKSMAPNQAKVFYRNFNDALEKEEINVAKGKFGAEMKVSSINDGPVTFFLNY